MLKRFFVVAASALILFTGTHFAAADKASADVIGAAPQRRTFLMEVTAYCHCAKCCGKHAHGITASGKDVSYNGGAFVAADTSVLPFGTKLSIPGYASEQPVEVIDRGGAIKGNHVDVYFPTHKEAMNWGKRVVPVTIVE